MRNDPDPQPWIDRLAAEARILGEARILRDEDEVTPEKTEAVFERFREYLKRVEKSDTWAARSMGVAASTLSQVLSGTYAAEPEKIIRSIDKWTEQQILRESAPKPAGFVRIGIAEKIYAVAKWAQKVGTIAVVHGPAGVGKTITAQAIRAETPGSAYVRITTAGQSKLAVLEAVATGLRIGGLKLTSRQIEQQLEQTLKDTNRLIIVDEIHKLVEKRKDEALHSLRDLHDNTGVPMLWLGMSNIASYIQTGKTKYESLDQLNSRIGWWLDIGEVAQRQGDGGGPCLYTIDDIRKVLNGMKIRVTADAERYLQMLANEPGQGGLRAVCKLLQVAMSAGGDKAISAERLRAIRAEQLGRRVAEQIEASMEQRAMRKVG